MTDQVIAVLQRGKELVAEGWCRGGSGYQVIQADETGARVLNVCAGIAVNMQFVRIFSTVEPTEEFMAIESLGRAAHDALSQTTEDGCKSVSRHNDHLESAAECLDWFDRAIQRVKDVS
jgi:hypothetical protein